MRNANYRTAKSNTQLFECLLSNDYLKIITNDELRNFIGGDPTPAQIAALVDHLFTTSPIFVQGSGLTTAYWDIFRTQVESLASTNVGYDLLTRLDTENKQITLSPFATFGVNEGGAAFDHNGATTPGGVIEIGSLYSSYSATTALDYYSKVANNFDTIAHEIFHAYVYIKTGVWQPTTPNIEMDAYLFGFMACAEMDSKRNIDSSNYLVGGQNQSYVQNELTRMSTIYDVDGSAAAGQIAAYKDAVWEMFHDRDFSLTNYNALASLFWSTSAVAQGSSSQVVTETTFDNSIIKSLWTNSYSQSNNFASYPPLFLYTDPVQDPGSGGGGGGFDPNYWGFTYDSSGNGGYTSGVWFTSWYAGTGGQGGGYDWDAFWDWIHSWSGTNWGEVDGVWKITSGEYTV